MAERRMFAKTIVLSDAFLDMPTSARCLYFTLGMLADDDGFVNSPRAIMRQCGASDDDMRLLVAKRFALLFDSGVIVVKHWRVNNYLRSDRYIPTKYTEEKAELSVDDKGIYHRLGQSGIPPGIPESGTPETGRSESGMPAGGIPSSGQDRAEQDRAGEESSSSLLWQKENEKEKDAPRTLCGKERAARAAHFAAVIAGFMRRGFPTDGPYRLAAAEGLTGEEIERAQRAMKEEEKA